VRQPLRRARRIAALVCVVLARGSWTYALNAALDASQYMHTSWKIRDGFAKGPISSIAQTPDGYLWLGTQNGLLRFDGVRTVQWEPPTNQRLPSTTVRGLLVTRDGSLWISTDKGLAVWRGKELIIVEQMAGSGTYRMIEDRAGSVWVTRFTTRWTLCEVQQARVTCHGDDGGAGAGAIGLFEDRRSNLWVGTFSGLWRWRPGPPHFYPLRQQLNGIQGLAEDTDGSLLIVDAGEIKRFADGQAATRFSFPSMQPLEAARLVRDRDGGVWLGTSTRGLVHMHDGVVDTFSAADGLSGDGISEIFEDRDGSIWVGTTEGLDRFREPAVVSYSVKQGLSSNRVSSVLASHDGSVWVGTYDGVNQWRNGRFTAYRNPPVVGGVQSMFEDTQRRLWLSTARGVGYFSNDRFAFVNGLPGGLTRGIVEDGQRTLWLANQEMGLLGLASGTGTIERTAWAALNRQEPVTALAVDPSGAGLWLGFFHGGIAKFSGGQVRASYSASDGLGEGRVGGLYVDRAGTLWVATDGGLSRLKNGRLSTLTAKSGLPCDAVGWVIEDATASLWLGMPCGLVRVTRREVDAWADVADRGDRDSAARQQVHTTVFDQSDGVRIFAVASYYTAPAVTASDGRVWFMSQGGVSVVDPARVPVSTRSFPLHIERVIADRKAYDVEPESRQALRLPPLVRDLEIDYTALNLATPEKVRFRHKLEGRDGDWQDVGVRRQAFYNDLRPGTYRFRVMAGTDGGGWNEAGTFLDFAVAPAYYQSPWFIALSAGLVLAGVWAAHRVRLRIVEKHEQEISALNERLMKAQEQERIRIAGELHDGVMQQMLAVTMMLGSAKRKIAVDTEAKATIDKAQEKLVKAGTDLRQLSHGLHPPMLQDLGLPQALRAYCDEFSTASGIPVTCEADDHARDLSRGAALALFRIVQEALGNAAKHAAAQHITVRLKRSRAVVSLDVSDDGKGFDRTSLGGSSGLGLITMRERAGQLNGTFDVESAPGRGTTIRVTIPFR
jgi:signal transduction histidine kinase/ligand-binding sensor domain-containing protein